MTLFDVLIDELAVSKGIVSDGNEVVPRLRIMTPEGQFVIFVPLLDEVKERERRLRLIAGFMAWKIALGFVISAETQAPEAITSFAVTRVGCGGFMRRIRRGRVISFGNAEELGAQNASDDLLALLPKRESAITREQMRELKRVFGPNGEMPAQRLRCGAR